ncbi:hypothetical protein KR084_005127, partial [Drosophila pseudotakahashii]
MGPGWVWGLRKEDLQRYGEEFTVKLTGLVDEMRKQFGEWVETHSTDPEHIDRLNELA